MLQFIKDYFKTFFILLILLVLLMALAWAGRSDYQEAQHRENRLENYDIMIENVNAGNHHLNRELLNK